MMGLRFRRALEYAACIAVLLVAAIIVLHPVFLRGGVPVAAESVLFFPPWESARPPGLEPPAAPELNSQAERFYPWFSFLSESLRQGKSLLWNPYEACGQPFYAIWRTRCLSPFSLPFALLPVPPAFQVSALLKLIVAGLTAFIVARRFGFAMPLSLLVALAFEVSAPMVLWLNWPMADVLPWWPLMLLLVERICVGYLRLWCLAAFAFVLMLLGGDPETCGAAALYCLFFCVAHHVLSKGHGPGLFRTSGVLFATVGVAVAVAAVQVIPFIEFVFHAAATGKQDPGAPLGLRSLATCFLPRFFGSYEAAATGQASPTNLQSAGLLYVGLAPVLLAPLWMACRTFVTLGQRCRIESMFAASLAMLALGTVFHPVIDLLPVFSALDSRHLLAFNALSMAFVAAAAAEAWLELDAPSCSAALRRLLVFFPVVLFAAAAVIFLAAGLPRPTAPGFGSQALAAGLVAGAVLFLVFFTLLRPSARTMGYGLAAAVLFDLLVAFQPAVRTTQRERIFPETGFISALQQTGTRVAGSEGLKRWPVSVHGISQVYGVTGAALSRHARFVDAVAQEPLIIRRGGTPHLLLTREDISGVFSRIRPVLRVKRVFSSGAVLFEDLQASPRARMIYDGMPVDAYDAALLDPKLPPIVERVMPPAPGHGPTASVQIDDPNGRKALTVQVEGTRPGVLCLADAWYPGWRATVGGERADIGIVDGLFRGVVLDEGSHEVRFTYDPLSLKLGMAVSLVALLGLSASAVPVSIQLMRRRESWYLG